MNLSPDAIERVVGDFEDLDLGDPRRSRRLLRVAEQLASHPMASFPDAMGSESELEGGYRVLNNVAVRFEDVLEAHTQATASRCARVEEVLVIHDTTTCQFSHASPEEVGYLPTGAAGFQLHVSMAVDAAQWRRPLGIVAAEVLSRKQRSGRGSRKRKLSGAETAKWKNRESERWWRGVESAAAALENVPHLHLADREGDMYELLSRMVEANLRFVIRNKHNRCSRDVNQSSCEWLPLDKVLAHAKGNVVLKVELSPRKGSRIPGKNKTHPPRSARTARLKFSSKRVEIRRPNTVPSAYPETIVVNVVDVAEVGVPKGEPAVHWRLFTTEPIDTAEQVARVVELYRTRWAIEEFNKALKTGCLYEHRQFESRSALLILLAISLPIACELLWMRSRARTEPNAPASDVLTPQQLDVLRALGSRKLSKNPNAREALLAIAAIGGHQRQNGEPGWLVLARAYRKLLAWEIGWAAARLQTEKKMRTLEKIIEKIAQRSDQS